MAAWIERTGSRRRTVIALIAGAVVSGILLWFALRRVSYGQVVDALSGAHWGWLPLSFAALLAGMGVRAERWRLLFDDPRKLSTNLSFASINIGLLFNNLLPQRAGELTRIVAVSRGAGISRLETAATIVAERMTDVFVLGVIGLAFWPLFPDRDWVVVVELICIVAAAGPIVAVGLLFGFKRHLPRIVQRLLHRTPFVDFDRSHQFTRSLADGTKVLLRPQRLFPVVLLAFISWGFIGFSNWLALQMFDFQIDDVTAMALLLVAVNFAIAIPVSPGAVGVFEAATQASLVAFGVSTSDALAYAVVTHAMAFFPFILLGGLGVLTVRRLSRSRLTDWESGFEPRASQKLESADA